MATRTWLGRAQSVAQVATVTIGSSTSTQTFTITNPNSKAITYVAGAGETTSTIAAALQSLLANSAEGEYRELTSTVTTNVITITARVPGVPFTISVSGTGTITLATTVANVSPNDPANPVNWSGGVVPQGSCATPVQANAAAISGGSLVDTTTYYWVVTATNANGETVKSNEKSLAISTPNLTATISWAAINGATGYKVYRTTSSGTYGATSLVAAVAGGSTVSYNDTGTSLIAGQPPGSGTALGDDVVLTESSVSLLWNLTTALAVNLSSFTRYASFTGAVNLPVYNANGYYEYRGGTLVFASCPTALIQQAQQDQAGQISLDFGSSVAALVTVTNANQSAAQLGNEVVWLTGSAASGALMVIGGSVALAMQPGNTANFTTVVLSQGGVMTIGQNTTLGGTLTNNSSTLRLLAVANTFTQTGQAATTIDGLGFATSIILQGGTLDHRTSQSWGGLVASAGTTITFANNPAAEGGITAGSTNINGACNWLDPNGVLARPYTLEIDGNVDLSTVSIQSGPTVKITIDNHS